MTGPLHAPKRRDVKALTAVLVNVKRGDYVSVIFNDQRYGVFRVTGQVCASSGDKTLLLGGLAIDSAGNRKPPTTMFGIDHVSAAGSEDRDADPIFGDVETNGSRPATSVVHGDVVAATFHGHPYGSFTVAGQAVAHLDADGRPGLVTLGPWILSSLDLATGDRKPGVQVSAVAGLVTKDGTAEPPVTAPIDTAQEAA